MTNVFSKRLVGAVGAVALTGGALGVVAPAQAVTDPMTYTCTSLAFTGAKQFTMVADTDAPRRIAYGETVAPTATATITVPEDVTTSIRDVGMAKKVDGKADVAASVDGSSRPWTLAVPQTSVPPNGALTLFGTGSAGEFAGTKVGTIYDVAVRDFTATLNLYNANGTPATPPTAQVTCLLDPGQNAAVDTVKVVKDQTTPAVKLLQTRQGAKAKVKVSVTAEHGLTPKGRIKAKLLRNGKVLQVKLLSLREGQRKVTFIRLKDKGGYAVKAKYFVNQNFKGSSTTVSFTID
ncbi:MAG: DUF6801 domain-containing protein [Nocardioides sp.]